MPYAITQTGWRAVPPGTTEADLAAGEQLVDEIPQWLRDQIAEAERLQLINADLNARIRRANAQVTALQARVNSLEFTINGQDPDDPDYIEPLDSEIAELPVRVAQLKAWNLYSTRLGRVKLQATWPNAPVWPVAPEPYNEETSARASAA